MIPRKVLQLSRALKGVNSMVCRQKSTLTHATVEQHRFSPLNKEQESREEPEVSVKPLPDNYRGKFPEFLPNTEWWIRDRLTEKLEREDMFRRRNRIAIPEFYVGSILAVTVADKHSPGKTNRFVGICIQRTGHGLRHTFILRNVIDGQGVEVMYEMYNPLVQKIEVLVLEKRLDEELFYLRDSPPEYSTFPTDMEPRFMHKDMVIPVNTTKVKLNPRPWSERWERNNLKGIEEIVYESEFKRKKMTRLAAHPQVTKLWEKEDIVKHYRESINPVETKEILSKVYKKDKNKWRK